MITSVLYLRGPAWNSILEWTLLLCRQSKYLTHWIFFFLSQLAFDFQLWINFIVCLSFYAKYFFHYPSFLFKSFEDIGKNVIHAAFCGNLQRIKIRQWNLVVYQSTPRQNMILTAAHLLAKWAICKRENSWHIFTKLRVVSFWCKVKRKKSLGNLLYNPTIRMKLMPSPSASSKFVLSVLKFLGILKFLRCTQNSLGKLKWANLCREI